MALTAQHCGMQTLLYLCSVRCLFSFMTPFWAVNRISWRFVNFAGIPILLKQFKKSAAVSCPWSCTRFLDSKTCKLHCWNILKFFYSTRLIDLPWSQQCIIVLSAATYLWNMIFFSQAYYILLILCKFTCFVWNRFYCVPSSLNSLCKHYGMNLWIQDFVAHLSEMRCANLL